jgi:hypothetical protein
MPNKIRPIPNNNKTKKSQIHPLTFQIHLNPIINIITVHKITEHSAKLLEKDRQKNDIKLLQ